MQFVIPLSGTVQPGDDTPQGRISFTQPAVFARPFVETKQSIAAEKTVLKRHIASLLFLFFLSIWAFFQMFLLLARQFFEKELWDTEPAI